MFVVAGASGNTGKVVAETLLAQKKPVRVLIRKAEEGETWKQRGAEVTAVELDDVAGLTAALRGATGASLLLPPSFGSSTSREDNAKRSAGYVKALEASGVAHVAFLSSVGAHLPSGTGPILSLHDAEAALRALRAKVTFVRAAYFMENWANSLYGLAQGTLPTFLKADQSIATVAAHDIGTTLAKALLEGGSGHSVIELSGPREYSPRDVAAALSRLTGKTVTVAEGPESAMIGALTGAGMNAHWAGLFQEMTHGLNAGTLVFEGGAARAVRGTTDVESVLKRLLG